MFIDTSGFLCSLDIRDRRHDKAASLYAQARSRFSHSYVIAELTALAESRKFSRAITLGFLSELLEEEGTRIVWADSELTQRAISLLVDRKDKSWSLCDAVSFILMEDHAIYEALTTDHHFEQAGFTKLLES